MASRSSTRARTLPSRHQPEQHVRAKWTKPLTEVLVDLMVDQVHKGNKQKQSFSKKAWTSISDDFIKKTGRVWDKEQLKNRFAVLKRQYSIVKLLLEQNDFMWDQTTGIITAEDEVWSRFIKVHPDAETVRTEGCPIYPQLCVIFSEIGTNSASYKTVHPVNPSPESLTGVSNRPVQPETPCPEPLTIFKEEPLSEPENNLGKGHGQDKSRPLISPNGRKRGRKGVDNAIAEAILEMAAASKLRAAAVNMYNDRYSIKECIRVLDDMKGIDQEVYNAALNLFNSHYAREIFLSLKVEMQFDWLRSKCSVVPGSS